jgi:hypothetical protein
LLLSPAACAIPYEVTREPAPAGENRGANQRCKPNANYLHHDEIARAQPSLSIIFHINMKLQRQQLCPLKLHKTIHVDGSQAFSTRIYFTSRFSRLPAFEPRLVCAGAKLRYLEQCSFGISAAIAYQAFDCSIERATFGKPSSILELEGIPPSL